VGSGLHPRTESLLSLFAFLLAGFLRAALKSETKIVAKPRKLFFSQKD
jgi:hypothetical protein